MIESGIGELTLNVNTDSQQQHKWRKPTTGPSCTAGLGAGADPELGKAAEEVIDEINNMWQMLIWFP